MIRKYKRSDIPQLIELFRLHHPFTDVEASQLEGELEGGINLKVMESNGRIVGMYNLHLWNSPEWGKSGELLFSVLRRISDKKEVLDQLWERAEIEIETNLLDFVMTTHDIKDHDLELLLSNHQFKEWFSIFGMTYTGNRMPDSGLDSRLYNRDDFNDYHKEMGNAFEAMRKEIDIRPYNIYENRQPERIEVLKEQMEDMGDKTYLFFQDGIWVGSAMIFGNEIDEIFVVPSQKGMGYGRRILYDCVNRILDKGYGEVSLKVVGWNKPALDLYRHAGFREHVNMKYLRKRIRR